MEEMMPILMPTEMDQEVLELKVQGAPKILASLKMLLKTQRKTLTAYHFQAAVDVKPLCACIDILCEYIKVLDTPYPASIVSAGFSYARNPKRYIEESVCTVQNMRVRIIPEAINAIQSLAPTEHAQHLICIVLKYLIAVKLGEDDRQDTVNRNEASMVNKMAHDVLQKQEPKMDFRRVSDLLITPLIAALREKLSLESQCAASSASPL